MFWILYFVNLSAWKQNWVLVLKLENVLKWFLKIWKCSEFVPNFTIFIWCSEYKKYPSNSPESCLKYNIPHTNIAIITARSKPIFLGSQIFRKHTSPHMDTKKPTLLCHETHNFRKHTSPQIDTKNTWSVRVCEDSPAFLLSQLHSFDHTLWTIFLVSHLVSRSTLCTFVLGPPSFSWQWDCPVPAPSAYPRKILPSLLFFALPPTPQCLQGSMDSHDAEQYSRWGLTYVLNRLLKTFLSLYSGIPPGSPLQYQCHW